MNSFWRDEGRGFEWSAIFFFSFSSGSPKKVTGKKNLLQFIVSWRFPGCLINTTCMFLTYCKYCLWLPKIVTLNTEHHLVKGKKLILPALLILTSHTVWNTEAQRCTSIIPNSKLKIKLTSPAQLSGTALKWESLFSLWWAKDKRNLPSKLSNYLVIISILIQRWE